MLRFMRAALYTLLGLIVVLAAAAAGGWHYRVELAQAVGERVASAALPFPVSFRLAALEPDGLVVEDIALGRDGAVFIDRLAADFSVEDLIDRRLARVAAQGVAISATLSADGEAAVGDVIGPDVAEATTGALPDWRIETVEIAGIRAHLKAEGRGEAFLSAEAHSAAPVPLRQAAAAGPLGLLALFAVNGTLEADLELRPPEQDAPGDRITAGLRIAADRDGVQLRATEPVALSTGALERWLDPAVPAARLLAPLLDGPAFLMLGDGDDLPTLDLRRRDAEAEVPAVTFTASTAPVTLRTRALGLEARGEAESARALTLEDLTELSVPSLLDLVAVAADLSVDVDAAMPGPVNAVLTLAGAMSLDAGAGAATLTIEDGFIAALDRWPAFLAAMLPPALAALADQPVRLPVTEAVELEYSPGVDDRPASVALGGDLRLVSGALQAALAGPARLNLAEEAPAFHAQAVRLHLDDAAAGPVRVTGALQLAEPAFRGAWEEGLSAPTLTGGLAADLVLAFPGGLDLAGAALGPTTAEFDLAGALAVAGGTIRLSDLSIARFDAEIRPAARGGASHVIHLSAKLPGNNYLSLDVEAFPEGSSAALLTDFLHIERRWPGDETATLALDRVGLTAEDDALDLTIADGSVRLPELGEATGLTAGLQHRVGVLTGRVGFAEFVRDGVAVVRGPVDVDLELRHSGPRVEGGARASHPSGLTLVLDGDYDPSQGAGQVGVVLPRTEIGPLAVAIGDVTDLAGGIGDAIRGFIAAEGEIALVEGAFRGGVRVVLDEISYEDADFALARVAGAVDFDLETAPATLPRQRLTGLTTAGPFRNAPFELVFDIGPGDTLTIHGLAIQAFGGTVALRDMTVNPYTLESRGRLVVTGADMESVVETIAVDDLNATGRMSGVVPVRIVGDRVIIAGGRLESDGTGRLSYWSPALAQAAQGDESIRLLVQALEDFRYDKLTLTVDSPEAGDGVASLRLEGRNPNVLDGYPFDININLETDFDKLARMLLDIYRRADILIRAVAQ